MTAGIEEAEWWSNRYFFHVVASVPYQKLHHVIRASISDQDL